MNNETIELTEQIYESMYEEPIAVLGMEFLSFLIFSICLIKLLLSSTALVKIKNIPGASSIAYSVIAYSIVVLLVASVEFIELENTSYLYVTSTLSLISSVVMLNGAMGLARLVRYLSKND